MGRRGSMAKTIKVDLGNRSYEILIGENILDTAGQHVRALLNRASTVIVTDENVARHQLFRLQASLAAESITFETIILPAGEGTKSISHLENLLEAMLKIKLERNDMIIALGGGVIGDLVGFAASVYLRGIDFIQVPTTLLAQVDSSVGGKTGINSPQGKNLIGAFHQPRLVIIDITTLETLEPRHIVAGYAEIVKYGLINNLSFFMWLERNGQVLISGPKAQNRALRSEAILKSCEAKSAIVAQDEKEKGVRALLNLGHTFGHALEAENGYNDNLLHGEAVAMGVILAFQLSEKMGLCSADDVYRVKKHFEQTSALSILDFNFNVDSLLENMTRDKKMTDGKLTFVIASGIGKSYLSRDVDMKDVKAVLELSLKG